MKIKRERRENVEGDMTPMIDMTFQLIAFFMVLINFTEVEQDQKINLPKSEIAKPPETGYDKPITLQMTKDETVLFGGDELTLDQIGNALISEVKILEADGKTKASDVTVVIRADADARTGKVQQLIEKAQDARLELFALRGQTTDKSTLGGNVSP